MTAIAKGKTLAPGIENMTWESTPPTLPNEDGIYPERLPGQYSPFA